MIIFPHLLDEWIVGGGRGIILARTFVSARAHACVVEFGCAVLLCRYARYTYTYLSTHLAPHA